MLIIVPLAGADFVDPAGNIKAEYSIADAPLLRKALESRPWWPSTSPEDYVFIFLDSERTRSFAYGPLLSWFPGAKVFFLSNVTRGAAISALVGIGGYRSDTEPLIIDLSDILYDCEIDLVQEFSTSPTLGAIALTFDSDHPRYSYLATDPNGKFLRAAEKSVISSNASAGTYIFSSPSVYLESLAYALKHEENFTSGGLFFICPLLNGTRETGRDVRLSRVVNVIDIKS